MLLFCGVALTLAVFASATSPLPPKCLQPKVVGRCRALIPRFFFNSTTHKCESFNYGGCGGNDNNFETQISCVAACESHATEPSLPVGRPSGPCQPPPPLPPGAVPMVGGFVPLCNEAGYFELIQFSGSSGYSWCVDARTGQKIANTEVAPGHGNAKCSECHKKLSEVAKTGFPPGAFSPRCTDDGKFAAMQCHGSTGFCFCVNEESGLEINGTRQRGMPNCAASNSGPGGPCKVPEPPAPGTPILVGAYTPQCTKNGYFELVQFHGSTGYSWCADARTGKKVPGTDVGPGRGKVNCHKCHKELAEAAKGSFPPGAFTPSCTLEPGGRYAPVQCHGSIGYCWCVNVENGRELKGTRQRGIPDCPPVPPPIPRPPGPGTIVPVPTKNNSRCNLPFDEGFIPIAQPPKQRYYYNKQTGKCTEFSYHGNPREGHGNNFASLRECAVACEVCTPNEVLNQCGSHCESRCGVKVQICTADCRPPACACKAGYSRHTNGNCVPTEQCTSTPDGVNGNVAGGPCSTEKSSNSVGTPVVGAFVPQCNAFGFYNLVQCHGSTGYCWCVNAVTGQKVNGTDKAPGAGAPQCSECHRRLAASSARGNPPGALIHSCSNDGHFEPVQCHGSIGYCWCVNTLTGDELPNTRVRGQPNCISASTDPKNVGPCTPLSVAGGNKAPPGAFTPTCNNAGFFKLVQCHGSTGHCWCVNPMTGAEAMGTRKSPGAGTPQCPECLARLAQTAERGNPPGAMIHVCTAEGDFEPVQCHGSTGFCWCVEVKTGEIVPNSTVRGPITCAGKSVDQPPISVGGGGPPPFQGPCAAKNANNTASGPPLLGAFTHQCNPMGFYKLIQCHGSTGYCWCANPLTGEEVNGTRVGPGRGRPICPVCLTRLDETSKRGNPPGALIHACTSDGQFAPVQCHGSIGYCWCVDVFTGAELPGTRLRGRPVCTSPVPPQPPLVGAGPPLLGGGGSIPTPPAGPCAAINQSNSGGPPLVGAFTPQCNDAGFFKLTQCHGSTGHCWCANAVTGVEVRGTRVGPGAKKPQCPECLIRLAQTAERGNPPGEMVHSCTVEGHFAPVQCHGSTGFCWCVNSITGAELANSRRRGVPPSCPQPSTLPVGPCAVEVSGKRTLDGGPIVGAFVPKCTDSGFYALTQCHGSSGQCWCVDTVTGTEINGTRVEAGRLAPICPGCYQNKYLIYISGQPTPETFIPQCEQSTGNYHPLQCQGSSGHCWCVDVTNGGEIPGTRTAPGASALPDCQSAGSIRDSPTSTMNPVDTTPTTVFPVANEICAIPKQRGRFCDGQRSQLRWYYDVRHYDCFAFRYNGCGGNANNFQTKADCHSRCSVPDAGACSGGRSAMTDHTGRSLLCGGVVLSAGTASGCPLGTTCVMGAFFGSCCNTTLEDEYRRNYNPTCRSRLSLVKVQLQDYQTTLLGTDCFDEFCPENAQCLSSGIFSHCCAKTNITLQDGVGYPLIIEFTRHPDIDQSLNNPGVVVTKPPISLQHPPECLAAKQRGYRCAQGTEQIRYFFDPVHEDCFAFKYDGCGGGANNFRTKGDCHDQCTPQDGGVCSGSHAPVSDQKGQAIICRGQTPQETPCPQGSVCKMGAFFGACCNKTIEDLYSLSYNPVCPSGQHIVHIQLPDYAEKLLGTDCFDQFCPAPTQCLSSGLFSYCCGQVPITLQEGAGGPRLEPIQDATPTTSGGGDTGKPPVELLANPECGLAKSSGVVCRNASGSLRFHYNPQHSNCFAFAYNGCGGNANNFKTKGACHDRCSIPDKGLCSGNTEPASDPISGQMIICEGPMGSRKCPQGSRCQMSAFFGACCNATIEDLYHRNYNPKCPGDLGVVSLKLSDYTTNLLGMDCGGNFCPSGSQCRQGELFAYCCSRDPVVIDELTGLPVASQTTRSFLVTATASTTLGSCVSV